MLGARRRLSSTRKGLVRPKLRDETGVWLRWVRFGKTKRGEATNPKKLTKKNEEKQGAFDVKEQARAEKDPRRRDEKNGEVLIAREKVLGKARRTVGGSSRAC